MKLEYAAVESQNLTGSQPLYRVRYATGELSPWITQLVLNAGTSLKNHALSVGTQVACLREDYEGVILGAINCREYPSVTDSDGISRAIYPDKAVIEYNADTHQLNAVLPSGATTRLTSTGGVTVDGDTVINGNLTVNGDVLVNGNTDITGNISIGGNGTVGGNFSISGVCAVGSLVSSAGGAVVSSGGMAISGGDVVVDGISVKSHTHPENGTGGGTTEAPQ